MVRSEVELGCSSGPASLVVSAVSREAKRPTEQRREDLRDQEFPRLPDLS